LCLEFRLTIFADKTAGKINGSWDLKRIMSVKSVKGFFMFSSFLTKDEVKKM